MVYPSNPPPGLNPRENKDSNAEEELDAVCLVKPESLPANMHFDA